MSRTSKATIAVLLGLLAVVTLRAQAPWQASGFQPFIYGTAAPTINCSPGSIYVQAATAPSLWLCTATNTWAQIGWATASGVPTGAIIFVSSGACPTGYTEVSALNGKMWRGTVAANGDVGTTGGSDSVTPTIAWPAGVPTFNGAQLATHLHAFGTIAVASHTVVATKQGTAAGNVVTTATHTVSGSTAAITAGTPSGTVAWPAGVPTSSAVDTRAAYINLIGCAKQ